MKFSPRSFRLSGPPRPPKRTVMSIKLRSPLTFATTILATTLFAASGASASPKFKVLHSFGAPGDGAGLYGGLAFDAKGNLYGGTSGGGPGGYGIVFQLAPRPDGRWKETILHSFTNNDPDGDEINGSLAVDAAGNLYGPATSGGGGYTAGTIFELIPDSGRWTLTVLHRFNQSGQGKSPTGPLIMDAAGDLYGTAGDPFELSREGPDPWTFALLHKFTWGSDLGNGGLVMDPAHNLYGTTMQGGTSKECGGGCGTAYELHRDSDGTWKEYTLHNFGTGNDDMAFPEGVLALDNKGNLYGVAGGGGKGQLATALYRLGRDPGGQWRVTIVHSFAVSKPRDGIGAVGGVVFDKAGNIYGMTATGGDPNCECGVVYKMTPKPKGKWAYTVLHCFIGSDGVQPYARPMPDDNGNLYGTTVLGGAYGGGVAFELTP